MDTEAKRIKKILTENHMAAFTLAYGYGMTYQGERITFPVGSIKNEKRNKAGRMIYSECHYEDNSVLIYRYITQAGYWSLTVK